MDTPVDLRSDTVTKPTASMRAAMAAAEVGDDVFGEDPTVNELQDRVEKILDKEASLFVPTGTMANLLAILSQTRPGDSVIMHEDAHPFHYESGGMSMIGGVMPKTLDGAYGILTPETVQKGLCLTPDHHYSQTTLVTIENTTNRGGGAIYPVETVAEIGRIAREHDIRVHCDGARIFNAVVAANVDAAEYANHVDTICFCFSKGLGTPMGSILAGPAETIERAHRYRKMLGGGMRQVGIVAAAALHALNHHIERLADDHRRAREFREALEDVPGITFPLPSPTNIVYLEVADSMAFIGHIAERGVFALPVGSHRLRCVFHLDVDDDGLARAIEAFKNAAHVMAHEQTAP